MRPDETSFDLKPVPPSAGEERAAIHAMKRRHGVLAWYGRATGLWWAVCNEQLVQGHHPEQLEAAVIRARMPQPQRWTW